MSPHPLDAWTGLPRVDLGRWPTPVREVAPGLWVKDEAASSDRCGGSKVRKLELLLADALRRGRRALLTVGAVGSHHVLATAVHGRRFGLATHAVLFPQPDTPHVRRVAAAIARACASVRTVPAAGALPLGLARARARHRRALLIAPGGSSALGTIGWIGAGLEVAEDVAAGRLPAPRRVYAPLGSGGTVAGLLAGLRLAGLDAEVVAVRVVPRQVGNAPNVRRLARGALRRLGRYGEVPAVRLDGLRIVHGFFGGGYGAAEPRAARAIARATGWGLHLEGTYSGKALACCLDEAPTPDRPALFVQTVGALDGDDVALPTHLARLLR